MQECEDIKRQLPISSFLRPAWDLETLGRIGVEEFCALTWVSVSGSILRRMNFTIRLRCFLIFAKKQGG